MGFKTKFIKIEQFTNKWKGIITLIGIILTFLTWVGVSDFLKPINKEIPPNAANIQNTSSASPDIYEYLTQLTPGINISKFTQNIGKPDIIHSDPKNEEKEYIYINPLFYLQAVTDHDENVLYFSVTSRNSSFTPSFTRPDPFNNKYKKITLNKTLFSDLSNEDFFSYPNCFLTVGVRRFAYFERYYEANPGNYQSFYIGINDAGNINEDTAKNIPGWELQNKINSSDECINIIPEFRSKATVNTYLVTGALYDTNLNQKQTIKLGVNLDEVRVINK